VIDVQPRVEVGVVEGAAVIMTGQPSEVKAFSGIMKRFFWVLIPVSSVIDAGASYSFRLPIKPRPESYFRLICLGDRLSLLLLICTRIPQLFYIFSEMTKDGNDSDGLGETHPAFWASHLFAADERRIRRECFIPSFIKIRFDENKSGAVARSDVHEVCVYEHMFKAGLRLPFIPIIRELLGFLNLSPHQLSPNAWRTFLACVILWPLALGRDHTLTIKEFLHLYRLQKNPQSSAAYNFQTKKGKFIQIDSQFSSNPKWKNKFFFVSGQWEFTPTEKAKGPRVP
jgi:hypothetical protein